MYTYKLAGSMKIEIQPFKRKIHKMVKHTQTIRRRQPMNCLSGFDHLVGFTLKGLIKEFSKVFI